VLEWHDRHRAYYTTSGTNEEEELERSQSIKRKTEKWEARKRVRIHPKNSAIISFSRDRRIKIKQNKRLIFMHNLFFNVY